MKGIIYEGVLLDESGEITLSQLSEICVTDKKTLIEMIDYGILEPQGTTPEAWVFSKSAIMRSKKAIRLHQDLEINWEGISLALQLLEEIEELRQVIRVLKKNG